MINDFDSKILKVTSSIKQGVIDHLEYIINNEKPDNPSLFAAGAAYVRLQNTFKAYILCLRTGLHFETLAMGRIIVEQLASIYRIYNYDGNFFKVPPNKCIKNLKKLIPFAGRLYGLLSNKLHIEPESTLDYIKVGDHQLDIVLKDSRQTIQNAHLLLTIYDIFCIVGEYIYVDLI